MTARRKFLFDTNFILPPDAKTVNGGGQEETTPSAEEAIATLEGATAAAAVEDEVAVQAEPEVEAPPPAPTFSEEEMAAARDESFRRGRDEALAEASSALEVRMNDSLGAVLSRFEEVFVLQTEAHEDMVRNAVGVATVLVRKMFPHWNQTHGLDEVEQMVHEALEHVDDHPKVIIRVNDQLREALSERVNEMADLRGHDGKIILLGSQTIVPGDCAIEWENGGMVRQMQSLWQNIDAIIERNLGLSELPPAVPEQEIEPTTEAQAEPSTEAQPKPAGESQPTEADAALAAALGQSKEIIGDAEVEPAPVLETETEITPVSEDTPDEIVSPVSEEE